jgi:leucyl aminopeptidase
VFSKFARNWIQQFSSRKVLVYLGTNAQTVELALVEDLVSLNSTPRYERSKFQYVKILTPDVARLQRLDPAREVRQRNNWSFRAWINENPDELTSITMGDRLAAFANKHGCTMETLEVSDLEKLGMKLLLAVGQASELSPSRLLLLTHNLQSSKSRPLLLVGKGITFDTGGINLKPHEGFVNCMKNDMGGAALMAHLFMGLVEKGVRAPIVLAIPTCENLIAERSMKPGMITTGYSGKSVIIEHTDAEGRLILADAISYAQKRFAPMETYVAATLTTAALRQFTNFFTPVHFAGNEFKSHLTKAGSGWGEEFTYWGDFLPFRQANRHLAADLTNMGRMPAQANSGGGSNVAAHFLREHASQPITHIDIFASTWNWSHDYPGAHYGATGAPFNSLFTAFLQQLS